MKYYFKQVTRDEYMAFVLNVGGALAVTRQKYYEDGSCCMQDILDGHVIAEAFYHKTPAAKEYWIRSEV